MINQILELNEDRDTRVNSNKEAPHSRPSLEQNCINAGKDVNGVTQALSGSEHCEIERTTWLQMSHYQLFSTSGTPIMRIAFALERKGDLICAVVHQLSMKNVTVNIHLSEVNKIESLIERYAERNNEILKIRYGDTCINDEMYRLSVHEFMLFMAITNVLNIVMNNFDKHGVFLERFEPDCHGAQYLKQVNVLVTCNTKNELQFDSIAKFYNRGSKVLINTDTRKEKNKRHQARTPSYLQLEHSRMLFKEQERYDK